LGVKPSGHLNPRTVAAMAMAGNAMGAWPVATLQKRSDLPGQWKANMTASLLANHLIEAH
jgi:hypothetical protein